MILMYVHKKTYVVFDGETKTKTKLIIIILQYK